MKKLRELRKAKGINQQKLADVLHVSRSTVAMWETGGQAGPQMLESVADYFGVTIDYLLDRDAIDRQSSVSNRLRIPVLGSIPAGIPIEAVEDIEDWEELPIEWARGGKEYFGLRIRGDSMSPKYEDGDIVIFRKQDTCENGQDCAVMVNGDDATFKRVRMNERGITLHPLNPAYDPMFYDNQEINDLPVRILGVVVQIRRDV